MIKKQFLLHPQGCNGIDGFLQGNKGKKMDPIPAVLHTEHGRDATPQRVRGGGGK